MAGFVLKVFFILATAKYIAKAESLEDLKQEYLVTLTECSQKYQLTPAEIVQLQEKKMPDTENAKCMIACSYKATGMMDEQGNLSVERVKQISEKYLSNNPEKLENAYKFVEACKSVNDQQVSDGDKGCERAALIFKCSVEQSAVFNFE